jgi:hypothetical protein
VDPRREDGVDLDAVVRHEHVEVAARVREQAELEAARPQLVEHRQRVLVQLEVLGALPGARHLDRAGVRVAAPPMPWMIRSVNGTQISSSWSSSGCRLSVPIASRRASS